MYGLGSLHAYQIFRTAAIAKDDGWNVVVPECYILLCVNDMQQSDHLNVSCSLYFPFCLVYNLKSKIGGNRC